MSVKQEQAADEGAVAIQAGRDVHVHGLQIAEVRELVQIFVERHLPALRAEAAAAARINADAFLNEFVNRLRQPNSATPEAFSKPDSQACFNTALIGSSEKGDQIDTGLLAEIVLRRLEADNDPIMKLVCEESVRALTKIGRSHIAFLAFIQYVKYVRHTSFAEIGQIEEIAKKVIEIAEPGLRLSEPNQEYLASIGALTINRVATVNQFITSMQQNYSFFPRSGFDVEANLPTIFQINKAYEESGGPMVFLTSVGKMIGMLALEKALGKVNLAVWIH